MDYRPGRPLVATKIVATIGPATASAERISELISAGVSIFRLNFSHGTQQEHLEVNNLIRRAAEQTGRPVAILQDLQGPKLRIGNMANDDGAELVPGETFRICTKEVAGTAERASTIFPDLTRDVRIGDTVLLDDGSIELSVTGIEQATAYGDEVVTNVVIGGRLKSHKGINLPGTIISAPAMTEKDIADLEFGIGLNVDYVALSFVRSRHDVLLAKDRIRTLGGTQPLISKIEKPQAVEHLEEIVLASDGIMVARGDLGVELSVEAVPLVQKRLIALCNAHGKPVITATQMLESMIDHPRPTRAEASDIANAILDGTDAVMLSGETAVGAWPIAAVNVMTRIAQRIERSSASDTFSHRVSLPVTAEPVSVQRSVASAARALAQTLGAKAIAVLTATGVTATRVSQSRPGVPIIAFTNDQQVADRLSLWYGVEPVLFHLNESTDDTIDRISTYLQENMIARPGEFVVIVGARDRSEQSRSVFLEVHQM
jgi:pyruvate kinase